MNKEGNQMIEGSNAPAPLYSGLEGLPGFISVNPLDGWRVEPFGDWDIDVAYGEGCADAIVRYAREIKQPQIISFVLWAIIRKAQVGAIVPAAIENGFFNRLAQLAYCGSMN